MLWNDEVARRDYMSVEARKSIQLKRLQNTVQTLYTRVPFYYHAFNERDITPQDIRTLSDLRYLPFTTCNDLEEHYPFGLLAVPTGQLVRVHTSPYIASQARIIGYTQHDLAIWSEVCARALSCAGLYPRDRLFNAYGYSLPSGGLGLHYGTEYLGMMIIPPAGNCIQRQLSILRDLQVTALSCTPSYALMLAEAMEQQQMPTHELSLRAGIFGAEPLTEEVRVPIERRLGLTALNIYGFSEVMGSSIAIECVQGRHAQHGAHGLHIFEDHFLPEIIDPVTEEVLPYGEEGELVLTTITQEGMPLLRYRTGDLCSLLPGPCACGRTLMRMSQVRGRVDDMLNIRGINVYPREIERILQTITYLAPHYQLIVERHNALDETTVQVEVTPQFQQQVACNIIDERRWNANSDVEQLKRSIQQRLQDMLDLPVEAQVLAAGSLPEGKDQAQAIHILDRRYKQRRKKVMRADTQRADAQTPRTDKVTT
jgi:Coenzyme F390 synthetase